MWFKCGWLCVFAQFKFTEISGVGSLPTLHMAPVPRSRSVAVKYSIYSATVPCVAAQTTPGLHPARCSLSLSPLVRCSERCVHS
jgi:hypothetical protein